MTADLSPARPERAPAASPASAWGRFGVGFLLHEVTRLQRAAFDARMQDLGLTGASWRILFRLSKQDGQTQTGLARRLDITPVAVGEALDRLEKSGHVERRADPDDRRKRRVYLTRKSIELLPGMVATAEALHTEIFQDMDEAAVAELAGVLGKLRARLLEMKVDAAEDEGEA